jgi:hypothetical protein
MTINDLCGEHLKAVERVQKLGNNLVRENIREYIVELGNCILALNVLQQHAKTYLAEEK